MGPVEKTKIIFQGQELKRKPIKFTLSLEKIINSIKNKNLDERITEILIKEVSDYPHGALEHWIKNFDRHLMNAQKQVNQK